MQNASLIHNFLENSAEQYPDKIALVHDDQRSTYAHINRRANRLSNYLLKAGIQPGDRVVFIYENSLEYVITYYAILKTAAVAVPLSTDLKPNAYEYLISEITPFSIIISKRFIRLFKVISHEILQNCIVITPKGDDVLHKALEPTLSFSDIISKGNINDIKLNIDQNKLASIIYTSGSTGPPKGVMLTHKNIVSNTASIIRYLELTEIDIQMVVLPFFYVMGKSLLNTHVAAGGTVVLNNQFAYPAKVINQMINEKVTGFSGVPSTYAYLLHKSPLGKYRDELTSLRYCSQAGGHMADAVKIKLREILPDHTKIFIMYGATEASARLTYLHPDKYNRKLGSIGKPINGVNLKIVSESGGEVQRGEGGELVASGDNIMLGYWNDEGNSKVLSSIGYHTGDIGYQDEEGYFYVTGRKDNIIKVGGHKINPTEIEDALMATNLVIEVAVIGVPDDMLGNKIVAIVVPKENNLTDDKLFLYISKNIPRTMMPSLIKLVRSLPKNASGKINRDMCHKLATS